MKLPKFLKYDVIAQIGKGGFGVVYDAINKSNGKRVAIKMLKVNISNKYLTQKFKEEANIYLYLKHKNITQLHDFIIDSGNYFLVMDFIEGRDLDYLINNVYGPIPTNKAIKYFVQILEGIEYAHEKEIIHLDLKPSNIMITKSEKVKILDFGISRKLNLYEESNYVTGSPLFMSPEQLANTDITTKSDIYSLGMTLYQMVSGKPPQFNSNTKKDIKEIIRNQYPKKASSIYPVISKELEAVINKSIRKNPDERFASCNEFRQALEKV